MAENSTWNAKSYDSVSTVQQAWGKRILASLPFTGRETVLDAGCGTARLSEMLAEAVPQGLVLAVDNSAEMLDVAAERLTGHPQIRLVRADLTRLPFAGSVDMIFSNAVFHWIKDHGMLFRSLAAALRPGGRLIAQCGGFGNLVHAHEVVEEVMEKPRYAPSFRAWQELYFYPTPGGTRPRPASAGFSEIEVSLTAAPTPFETRQKYHDFVGTVILRAFQSVLPADERPAFVNDFVEASPAYNLDYVRLNISAVKSDTS